jgi:hypothetical protein
MNGGNRNIRTHNEQCPVCTTILVNQKRSLAMRGNLARITETMKQREYLYLILAGLLKRSGGEILLHNPPNADELEGLGVDYRFDDDGVLHLTLKPVYPCPKCGALNAIGVNIPFVHQCECGYIYGIDYGTGDSESRSWAYKDVKDLRIRKSEEATS